LFYVVFAKRKILEVLGGGAGSIGKERRRTEVVAVVDVPVVSGLLVLAGRFLHRFQPMWLVADIVGVQIETAVKLRSSISLKWVESSG
jgi:hypothetical protein